MIKIFQDIFNTPAYSLVKFKGTSQQNSGVIFSPYVRDIFSYEKDFLMKMKEIMRFMKKHPGNFTTKERSDFRTMYKLVKADGGLVDSVTRDVVYKYSQKIKEMKDIIEESK